MLKRHVVFLIISLAVFNNGYAMQTAATSIWPEENTRVNNDDSGQEETDSDSDCGDGLFG